MFKLQPFPQLEFLFHSNTETVHSRKPYLPCTNIGVVTVANGSNSRIIECILKMSTDESGMSSSGHEVK